MFLLLHLPHTPILKSPLDNISVRASTLDLFSRLERSPEVGERGEFNEMPDLAEVRGDEGGFRDKCGSGDGGGHFD